MRNQIPRLLIDGGILSPAELKRIAEVAESGGLKTISFGSRQDILLPEYVGMNNDKELDFGEIKLVNPASGSRIENIVSSYVSTDIFPTTSWITGDLYLYIIERIKYGPRLKINITEPRQRIVPLFMGHLNFIASEREDYWYLYIRLPDWNKATLYPALIYSWDIAKICEEIENLLQEEPENVDTLFSLLNYAVATDNKTIDKPLEVPFYPFPYYEGMNRIGTGEYWLGLYWRNNRYDLQFLKVMCDLCFEWKIGKICITPWKSFIIKGIPAESKLQWEKLLGKFGINVRHSLLEMNWHLPVANDELLKLKRYIVDNFDRNDISTYGLTFSITDHARPFYYFTSIVVRKNTVPESLSNFEIRDTYDILYATDFDPNTRNYIMYAHDVDQVEVPGLLMELSRIYFEQLGTTKNEEEQKEIVTREVSSVVYQCSDCSTIYDERYGDEMQNIAPGIPFENLPRDYQCPVCEAPKSSFILKEEMAFRI